MTEIELIVGGVLASSVGLLFFLRHLRSAKKIKSTSQEEPVAILEDEPFELEPESKKTVQDVKSEKIEVIVKEEVKIQTTVPTPKIEETEKELEINKQLPQDSMLRRHYLTHLEMMLELIYPPYPTDSALKRHYQTMITAKIEDCLNDKHKMVGVIFNYEAVKAVLKKKLAIVKLIEDVKPKQQEHPQSDRAIIPEDSVQRRHYLTNARSIIESNHTPSPTDSTLKRHYNTLIDTEVEQYLLNITV